MERGALSTEEFREFAKDYVLFCHITSMVEGEKYGDLLSKKGGKGFPHVVAMDAKGDVLAVHAGARSVEGFAATMQKGREFQTLLAKEELTAAEAAELFLLRLGMGHFDLEQARTAAAKLADLSAEDRTRIDDALLGMEIQSLAPKSRGPEAAAASGKAYAEMLAAGRKPVEAETPTFQMFYILIMEYAFQNNDVALYEQGLARMKAVFGENPQAAPFFEAKEKQLAELKARAEGDD
jgi:hypothetical protein